MKTESQKRESAKRAVSKPFMTVTDVAHLCRVGNEKAKKMLAIKKVECVEGLYQTDRVIESLHLRDYVERINS